MSPQASPQMNSQDLRSFEAAAERILPATAGLPSAGDAGVARYLERRAAEPGFETAAKRLREGFALLDALSQDEIGCDFADASEARQEAVLRRLEAMPVPAARRFFETLINLTLTGYLCDPVHGGNRDRVAWQALGIHIERVPVAP